jgi:hypothetical protein
LDVLIIPKEKISQLSKAKDEHKELLGHMLLTANEVAKKEGIINSGFRIVINDGKNGGLFGSIASMTNSFFSTISLSSVRFLTIRTLYPY